ncbi:MAG: primosomal protein N' [Verrucomicrobia bacterium]|jgi:primosomal protein N' (replication factor Y)|nr:primosomal protein N' [Verrucomicrobiota bacterium]
MERAATEEPVLVVPLRGVGRELAYRAGPAGGLVEAGSLVRIPLGRRVELGVVVKVGDDGGYEGGELKSLQGLVQPFPVLREEGLELARWMAAYYSCGREQVLEVMIPRAVRQGMAPKRERVLRLGKKPEAEELAALEKRAPQQGRVLAFLAGQLAVDRWPRALLRKRLEVSPAVLDGLVEKGWLREEEDLSERLAYDDELAGAERVSGEAEVRLTEEQAAAARDLEAAVEAAAFTVRLLHGVTGSGKTEVYMRVMERVLRGGGGVIFLVPEVALTPQTVGRLRARFAVLGEKVVVWHSHLSDGQRADAWRALARGESRIVVGARSAVFAPVANLRLIVVDEEHEPAYKQEEVPRYHGRDVAVYRAMLNGAVCLLGSATPSLESLHNVATGKYGILHLRKRVDDRQLPLLHVVDMRREKGGRVFSQLLADKMRDRFERREQTILFLNRRGHDSSLHCPDCGYVAMCDHCDITLTHHLHDKRLRCHMCGDEAAVPRVCPNCRSPKIHYKGSGTQKVEAQAARILPGAKVVRIDADTMRRRHAFREHLSAFRQGKIDVLVGTQMIGKGLDFPNVTLVGLMDADLSLHLPDFRASERSFQLLVQVSGRSGRGDRSGEVVVQSYLPSSPPIQFARQQDFDGFTSDELEHRREFGYPPYRHLLHHLFRGKSVEKVRFYAEQWRKQVEPGLKELGVEIKGPAPCPVERIQDFFRYQLWYFCGKVTPVGDYLSEQRRAFQWDKEVIEILDVDAVNLL